MKHLTSARSFIMAIFALAIVLSLSSLPASASQILSDDALLGGPGWYNGTGGTDGDFTILTSTYSSTTGGLNGTLQLGQRVEVRYVGNVAPTVDNVYNPPADAQVNVDWSVLVSGGLALSDFAYMLTIDDTTTGMSTTLDPSSTAYGDAYWNGTAKTLDPTDPGNVGFQNSEYLGFGFIQSVIDYKPGDSLTSTLSATPAAQNADPSVAIIINTSTPEPATFGLAGAALLGLGLMRKKFKV